MRFVQFLFFKHTLASIPDQSRNIREDSTVYEHVIPVLTVCLCQVWGLQYVIPK